MTNNDALISDYLGRLEAAASGLPAERRAELIEEISAHITEATTQPPSGGAGRASDLLDVLGRLGDPEDIVRAASDSPALALVQTGGSDPGIPAFAAPEQEGGAWPGGQGARTSAPPDRPATSWSGQQGQIGPGPLGAGPFSGGPFSGGPSGAGPASGGPYGGGPYGAGSTAGPHGTTPLGPPDQGRGDYRQVDSGAAGHWSAGSAQSQARPGGLEIAAVALALGSTLLVPFVGLAALVIWLVGIVLLWYSARWRVSDKVLGTLVLPVGVGLVISLRRIARATGGLEPPRLWLGGYFPVIRVLELVAILAATVVVAVRLLRQASSSAH
jgi:hypothetical protein